MSEHVPCRDTSEGVAGRRSTGAITSMPGKRVPGAGARTEGRGQPSNIRGGSRMQESCTYGSVRGAPSNGRPYRNPVSELRFRRFGAVASRKSHAGPKSPISGRGGELEFRPLQPQRRSMLIGPAPRTKQERHYSTEQQRRNDKLRRIAGRVETFGRAKPPGGTGSLDGWRPKRSPVP